MSENEYWSIKPCNIPGKEKAFIITKFVNNRPVENYSGNAAKTILNLSAVINGFEPPRSLVRLDKPSD